MPLSFVIGEAVSNDSVTGGSLIATLDAKSADAAPTQQWSEWSVAAWSEGIWP